MVTNPNRLLACVLASAVAIATTASAVQWRSTGPDGSLADQADAARRLVQFTQKSGDTVERVVVRFEGPVSAQARADLNANGVQLLTYLGDHAYFAAVGGAVASAEVLESTGLRAVADIRVDWKLHPVLARGEIVPWAVLSEAVDPDLGPAPVAPDEDPLVAAYVVFHRDVALARGVDLARRLGATVRSELAPINALVVELPYQTILTLAAESEVQWIEPPLPALEELNFENRQITGAELAQAPPYNLDGAGVRVQVYDGGTIRATHLDFENRARIGDSDGVSDHATHVAGTVGGAGIANPTHRGMAPGVMIDSYGFEVPGGLQAGFLYTDPGDILADYTDSVNNFGSDISTNSIGSNVSRNGFDCAWQGDYGTTSALIDSIVRGSALGAPHRVVWAGGNERGSSNCTLGNGGYRKVAPPSGAKNHLSIGALNANDDSMTSFSSWGPTDDGRMKPDFSGPGCQSGGDGGITSAGSASDMAYTSKCGTSMSTPTVAGLLALLMQDYRANYPGEPDFRNSMAKAVFCHTAEDDAEFPGPDYRRGYGSVRIVPAIDLMRAGNFLEEEVAQDGLVQFLVFAGPTDTEVKVTMAWDDPPAGFNAIPTLVNNLDLTVIGPGGTTYFPWTLDPNNPTALAVRDKPNTLDNLEQVYIPNAAPGAYLIQVRGTSVPDGPQHFSLVATPQLIQCSTVGFVELDRVKYACDGLIRVSVTDCDLNTDDTVIDTVDVNIASTSEAAGETLTLIETEPQTANFQATISIDQVDALGTLLAFEGDDITVTYIDADDGFGNFNVSVTDTAVIDCTSPIVSNVAAIDVDPRSATITFETDELSRATVRYGTACGALAAEVSLPVFNTVHALSLSGLVDETTYFYEVEVEDQAGNVTIADNSGACFDFTTPDIPDYFTEVHTAFDLQNWALLWAPNGTIDFYSVCAYETLVLPTDPAGGTPINLGDSSSEEIFLPAGQQVLLYGQAYNSIFVGSNGYITLGDSDTDSSETIEDHFDQPRISALFDDLAPDEGGTVSYKALADRIAVTWQNVPEDGAGNSNTFQIELYYDGRIQVAWLNVAASDGITGLSAGGGVPIDYFQSDLSEYGDCGPRAPSAAGRTVEVGQGRSVTIDLLASDDGLPNPPGALTYLITALPQFELRDAGNSAVIMPGDLPYALVNGGKSVEYTPDPNFLGVDTFSFQVDDGGAPPDAGLSNVADIDVQVSPVLTIPVVDEFVTTTFDAGIWSTVIGATIDGVGINEPSPPNSARFNGEPSGGDRIVSQLIDLSGEPAVRLRYAYQRTGDGESPDSGDNLWIEYLDANGLWVVLDEWAGDGPDMTTYTEVSQLLPADALHGSFRLRIRSSGTSGAFDDWFVDDVLISNGDAPVASSQSLDVPQGIATLITLEAEDNDPNALSYTITSLPTGGMLVDPAAGVIMPGDLPYTLAANQVEYTSVDGFSGPDAFTFEAFDGQFTSNTATVSIFVEPVLSVPFFDDFPSTTLNPLHWSVVIDATVDDVGIGEPSAPYALRLNGDPGDRDIVETFPINASNISALTLEFFWQRTGDGDSPESGEDLVVEYLSDAATWIEIARYPGDGPDMTVFEFASFELPADATHAGLKLRFSIDGSSPSIDDFFVDDIRVFSENSPKAFDVFASLVKFGWADIALSGSDPQGLPLSYIITALPTDGVLRDSATAELITDAMLPYTLSGPSVRYVPNFGYTGEDAFSYLTSNGGFDSAVATGSVTVGGVSRVIWFPLDSNPGWTTEGDWEFGVPQGQFQDPTGGFTGQNVYGYNLNGRYAPSLPATFLTTTALDCSSVTGAELSFQRWLGIEDSIFDQAFIEVSNDGSSWTEVWRHTGGNLVDTDWVEVTYDISAVADNQSTVYIRWSMGPTDSSAQFAGWNIDDVAINGQIASTLGDFDGDGDADDVDYALFRAQLGMCAGDAGYDQRADYNGDNCVNAEDYCYWLAIYRERISDPTAPAPGANLCDVNNDGAVNALDIDCFVQAVVGGGECVAGISTAAADANGDGVTNALDIDAFVSCIIDGVCQ